MNKKTSKHQTTIHPKEYKNKRLEKVAPILEKAVEGCERLGGIAEIDDNYTIVDTRIYEINRK